MACPYFYPVEVDADWQQHPRMPLGDPYTGHCRADPRRHFNPDPATLRGCCNPGYARERCPRFPAGKGPDSYRFAVIGETGGLVNLFYVAERAHSPLAHGALQYAPSTGGFLEPPESELLLRQAEAYLESYFRRKSDPDHHARNPNRR